MNIPRLAAFVLMFSAGSLSAEEPCEFAVANDQSVSYTAGIMNIRNDAAAGGVSLVYGISSGPVTRDVPDVPTSVIGPPTSIALHPSLPLAIVAGAMTHRIVNGQMTHVADNQVTLLGTGMENNRIKFRLTVGSQPSSVGISPDGRHALVTNRGDGSLSVLRIEGERLVELERVPLCDPDATLSHVEISPDGSKALATLTKANRVLLLSLDRNAHPEKLGDIETGDGPYVARFLPGGRGAVIAEIGSSELLFVSLSENRIQRGKSIPVGRLPEGLDVSPDGEWIAAACLEGGNLKDRANPKFGQTGRIYLLRRSGGAYENAQVLDFSGWPQAAVFTVDGEGLVVANTGKAEIVFCRKTGSGFEKTGKVSPTSGEPIAAARRTRKPSP
jgi:DNA-binding beta-propeller fold protein YncE